MYAEKMFFVLLIINFFILVSYASVVRMEISNGWNFCQARLNLWHPAVVPGVVHLDLMRNKIIDDPYLGLNERGVQWVDKEDWIYEHLLTCLIAFFIKKIFIWSSKD